MSSGLDHCLAELAGSKIRITEKIQKFIERFVLICCHLIQRKYFRCSEDEKLVEIIFENATVHGNHQMLQVVADKYSTSYKKRLIRAFKRLFKINNKSANRLTQLLINSVSSDNPETVKIIKKICDEEQFTPPETIVEMARFRGISEIVKILDESFTSVDLDQWIQDFQNGKASIWGKF